MELNKALHIGLYVDVDGVVAKSWACCYIGEVRSTMAN